VVGAVGLAGCGGSSGDDSTGSPSTASPDGSGASPDGTPTPTPTDEAETTESDAGQSTEADQEYADEKDRALSAERTYVRTRLTNASCVDNWGLQAVGITPGATVTNTTGDAVYVEATQPYSYNVDGRYADVYSVGTYRVTPETVERIEGDGVSPC
jgi:hypothetical protein